MTNMHSSPAGPDPEQDNCFETEIQKIVTGGSGLGRYEKRAAFIPLTAPGDRIRARIKIRKKGYVEAELDQLLSPGPQRQEAPCPHFGQCGGCDLQHLTDQAQRDIKVEIVADCFRRLGKFEVSDILTGPDSGCPALGYRNKIRLFASPIGHYGLRRRGSHEVVPLTTCLQMPESFNRDVLPWLRELPPMQELVVRLDGQDGWLLSLLGRPNRIRLLRQILGDLPEGQPPRPGCRGVLFNKTPVWGRDYLVIKVAEKKFRVGAQSFFQTNLAVAEAIVGTLSNWLDGNHPVRAGTDGLLIDLYCGVGLFSLALADRFAEVVAVDADTHAVHDARNNIQRDGIARGRVTVRQDSVERYLQACLRPATGQPVAQVAGDADGQQAGRSAPVSAERWQHACCLVDPPRSGLGARSSAHLVKLAPREIVYLSCDPATLARDTALLVKAGYQLLKLRVFDMFPQTAHVETLAYLARAAVPSPTSS